MIDARMCANRSKQLRILTAETHRTEAAYRVPTNSPSSRAYRKGLAHMIAQIFDDEIFHHLRSPLRKSRLYCIRSCQIEVERVPSIRQYDNQRMVLSVGRKFCLVQPGIEIAA